MATGGKMKATRPATCYKYEGEDCFTLQIDNPNGGLPVETQFERMGDVQSAVEELAACVGLPVDEFFISFAE